MVYIQHHPVHILFYEMSVNKGGFLSIRVVPKCLNSNVLQDLILAMRRQPTDDEDEEPPSPTECINKVSSLLRSVVWPIYIKHHRKCFRQRDSWCADGGLWYSHKTLSLMKRRHYFSEAPIKCKNVANHESFQFPIKNKKPVCLKKELTMKFAEHLVGDRHQLIDMLLEFVKWSRNRCLGLLI